jgi:hypothetical protein
MTSLSTAPDLPFKSLQVSSVVILTGSDTSLRRAPIGSMSTRSHLHPITQHARGVTPMVHRIPNRLHPSGSGSPISHQSLSR